MGRWQAKDNLSGLTPKFGTDPSRPKEEEIVAVPALVIGLGGTGVKALTYAKQDLMRNNDGVVPPEVTLLAFDTTTKVESWWHDLRVVTKSGRSLPVRLESKLGEYVHIGGWSKPLVEVARTGDRNYFASWLQESWMLNNLPDHLFNIEDGAAQMRQMGRLAVFYDLDHGDNSKIRKALRNAINKVAGHAQGRAVQVFIVASVAGGTGSGMFVDIAYLVRKLAGSTPVFTRGFVVLPTAFRGEPGLIVSPSMKGQGYAALREIDRFMSDFREPGYPMHYTSDVSGPEDDPLQGAYKSRLFDMLYVVDGKRRMNNLDRVELRYGVAPTLGEFIAAHLDQAGGQVFDQHKNNIMARGIGGHFYSSLGTYTKVLPVNEIVNKFAHQMAYRALSILFPPAPGRVTKAGSLEVPLALSSDSNREAGGTGAEHAFEFLDKADVTSRRDPNLTAGAPRLFSEIRKVESQARKASGESKAEASLLGLGLQDWLGVYTPTQEIFAPIRQQVEAQISRDLELIAPTSDKVGKEHACDGAQRIERAISARKNSFLGGEIDSSRRRAGGELRGLLERYHTIHLETMRKMLPIECENILKGASVYDKPQALGGKLGYVIAFLDELARVLESYGQRLANIENSRRLQNRRKNLYAAAEAKKKRMYDRCRSRWPGEATRVQGEYLKAEQELMQFLMADIIRQSVRNTVQAMQTYVKQAAQEFKNWADALAQGPHSLFAQVAKRLYELEGIIKKAGEDTKVQNVIRDEAYEKNLFEKYGGPERLGEFLASVEWKVPVDPKKEDFSLTFQVAGEEMVIPREFEDDERKRRVREKNQEIFLSGSRQTFSGIWENESILRYFVEYKPGQQDGLGREFVDKGGVLLSIASVTDRGWPGNYLRARFVPGTEEESYLRQALLTTAGESGAEQNYEDESQSFARLIQCDDPFKMSFIYTKDLYDIDMIQEHMEALPSYLGWQGKLEGDIELPREMLHIFPAEVHAARFEKRAVEELHQDREKIGPFTESVVKMLEDLDRLKLFCYCYITDLIKVTTPDETDRTKIGWVVDLPEEPPKGTFDPATPAELIHLTKPETGEQQRKLLDALHTFEYLERDIVSQAKSIDYARCRRAVEKALKCLIEKVMRDEEKPVMLDERHRKLLPKLPDDAMRETVTDLLLAKDVIQRRVDEKIGAQLKRLGEELKTTSTTSEEFDLYSVMYLVLKDWARERFDTGAGLLMQYI